MVKYVLIPRSFYQVPRYGDVGHLCVNRAALERDGRAYSRKAREWFYSDLGREAEQARMDRAAREAAA